MTKSKSTKYCIGCVAMTFMVYTVFSMAAGNSLFAENHEAAAASETNHINWVTSDKRSSIGPFRQVVASGARRRSGNDYSCQELVTCVSKYFQAAVADDRCD